MEMCGFAAAADIICKQSAAYDTKLKSFDNINTARVVDPRARNPIWHREASAMNSQQISVTCWMMLGSASPAKRSTPCSTSSTQEMGRLPSAGCPGLRKAVVVVAMMMAP